jgi:hypothetical protein
MRNHGHLQAESAVDNANLAGRGLAEMPKSPRSSPNPIRVIDALTYPAVQLLDVTGPVQVFASANDLVVNAGGTPPYLLKSWRKGGAGAQALSFSKPDSSWSLRVTMSPKSMPPSSLSNPFTIKSSSDLRRNNFRFLNSAEGVF